MWVTRSGQILRRPSDFKLCEQAPQMTRLLELLLGPSDTFLDVGGNEGYFFAVDATE